MILEDIPASKGISILYGHRILPTIPNGITPYHQTTLTCSFLNGFFARHKRWQALSLDDVLNNHYDPTKPAFALTFDDGYQDNLTYGLPLFEEWNVPVTIFITHDFCFSGLEPLEHHFASCLHPHQKDIYDAERQSLKSGNIDKRKQKLQSLITQYGLQDTKPKTPFLNQNDLKALHAHPLVSIGYHTKTHPLLTRLNPFTLWTEIKSDYKTIAYPYGGHRLWVKFFAKIAQYTAGFTTKEEIYNPQKHGRFSIPRIELKQQH